MSAVAPAPPSTTTGHRPASFRPDVEGLRAAADAAAAPVIASGGVATLADVEQLAGIDGLGGVITGKALYEGRFTVAAALATLSQADR